MKVTYFLGIQSASEWVCFEHRGFAREKAVAWWRARATSNSAAPMTVDEAISRRAELAVPESVVALFAGKYPEIRGYNFPVTGMPQPISVS
jgi:DNA repair protein RadD